MNHSGLLESIESGRYNLLNLYECYYLGENAVVRYLERILRQNYVIPSHHIREVGFT